MAENETPKQEPQINQKAATFLYVIRGLIRPIIALSIVSPISYLIFTGGITPENALAIAGTIIGFYFGERAVSKVLKSGK